jgi:hypothetical protein
MPAPPHVYPGFVQSPQFILAPHPLPTIPQYWPLGGLQVTHIDVSGTETSLPGSIPPGPPPPTEVPPTEVPGPPDDPPLEAPPVPVDALLPESLRVDGSLLLVHAPKRPSVSPKTSSVVAMRKRMTSPFRGPMLACVTPRPPRQARRDEHYRMNGESPRWVVADLASNEHSYNVRNGSSIVPIAACTQRTSFTFERGLDESRRAN